MRPIALLVVLLTVMTPARNAASMSSVTVRTYNYANVPDAELAAARTTASAIFQKAGIALIWIACRVGDGEGHPCIERVADGTEFILRLKQGEARALRPSKSVTMGVSMLDTTKQGGILMTIAVAPLAGVADEAAADRGVILGRAIAHELGHLLLGTSTHPPGGLMRTLWTQEELRGSRPVSWHFSRSEAQRMQQRLTAPSRAN